MAGDREAKITFRAETSEFDSNLKKAKSTMQDLRSELKLNESDFKNTGDKAKFYSEQAKLLEAQLSANRDKQQALNSEIEVAKRVFGEDSEEVAKLQRQLNYAQIEENNLQSALANCNSELKKSESATEQLNNKIDEQERELKDLTNQYKDAILEQGKESDEAQRLENEINELNSELTQNKSKMRDVENAAEELTREMDDLDDETGQVDSGFTTLKGTLANLAAEGISRAIDGIKDLAGDVMEIGMSFEDSMARVQALSGATGDEFTALSNKAKELGSSTRFTASEVADGFGYMSLAGWDTSSMLEGITGVLTLAQAAEMDLGQASDIVTDYLTAFGLSAADSALFVDQMAYAMANSNTDVTQLGEAYKNCASTAASLGYSVEDTTAVIMTMANAGVKGGEAGTALNAIMTRLATDTKGCATELEKYGVAIYDSEGNMNSLSSILEGMSGIWGNLNQEQQANLSKIIAGQSQYASFQTIMSGLSEKAKEGGQSFTDYSAALESCSGTAQNMADVMNNTVSGDLAAMESAFQAVGVQIFEGLESPLRDCIQFVTGTVVPGLSWLVSNMDTIGPIVLGVGTAFGILAVAMNMSTIISTLTQGLTLLTTSFSTLFSFLMANPFVALAAVIAGVVVALVTLWNTNEEFRNVVMSIWEAIWSFLEPIVTAIGQGITWLTEQFGFLQPVVEGLGTVFGWVADGVSAAWDFITGSSEQGSQAVTEDMQNMESATAESMSNMDSSTNQAWSDIVANTNASLGTMQSDTASAFSTMESDAASSLNSMSSNVSGSYNGMNSDVNSYMSQMESATNTSMSSMSSNVSSASNSMESDISSAMGTMENDAHASFNQMASSANTGLNEMSSTISSCMNQAVTNMNSAVDQITNIWWWGIQDMVSNWNNANFGTPYIKMPHISISGTYSIDPPSAPTFSVSWYKKGAILNAPTIFGAMGGSLLGGGEAGPEAVLPIDKLQGFIDIALERYLGSDMTTRIVEAVNHLAERPNVLTIDGHEFALATASASDLVAGTRQNLIERGLAL